jgi:hypothetical protein
MRETQADSSAHLGGERSQSPATANGSSGKVANPLAGLVPRKVTVEQAKAIMVSSSYPNGEGS